VKNIGRVSRRWLYDVGIITLDDLKQCGSVAAYRMIKSMQPKATLNLLWALEGATLDIDWRKIARQRKVELLERLNGEIHD